jgi:hypothetical protein
LLSSYEDRKFYKNKNPKRLNYAVASLAKAALLLNLSPLAEGNGNEFIAVPFVGRIDENAI